MGKTVIRASDGPGFLVNRCNRPFGLEALRLLQERIADVETIDRICRMEGGFRMGPFELMDLVGVDMGFEISKSFYEQSFGEPRWRPSPIAARYVAAGLHGRKAGRGYYTYPAERPAAGAGPGHRPADPDAREAEPPANGEGVVVIDGEGLVAQELRHEAATGRVRGALAARPHRRGAAGAGDRTATARPPRATSAPRAARSADARAPGRAGGAHLVLCAARLAGAPGPGRQRGRLSRAGAARAGHAGRADAQRGLLAAGGGARRALLRRARQARRVGRRRTGARARADRLPGDQRVAPSRSARASATRVDIDTGMVLGLSHPRGPLEWADTIGLDHVLGVLEALCDEYGEERYRAAPALRRLVHAGRLGRVSGAGFFDYDGEADGARANAIRRATATRPRRDLTFAPSAGVMQT